MISGPRETPDPQVVHLPSRRRRMDVAAVIRRLGRIRDADFACEFLPDGAAIENRPYHWAARSTVYVLTALSASVVAWAALSHIDRVVVAQGRIITTAPTVVVQPLETAIIRSIEVTPGDVVRAGAPLATLDPTFATADLADLQSRRLSADAHIARLRAELDGAPFDAASAGPDGPAHAAILEQRRAEYRSRLASYDERVAELEAGIATARRSRVGLGERIDVLAQLEDIRQKSVDQRTGSRVALLEARTERLRLRDDQRNLEDKEAESLHELARQRAERAASIDEWRRKAGEEMIEQIRQRATVAEQLTKAERRRSLVSLTAPIDAVVLEVAKRSVGSVIKEAETLVTLVPKDVPLEAEVDIVSADIGRVRAGDDARVKLDAFPFQRHGTLPGEVRTISADAFQREPKDGGGAVFRVRVRLLSDRLADVPEGIRPSPGMVATAEVRIGTRTILSYFLYPIIRAFDESIREP